MGCPLVLLTGEALVLGATQTYVKTKLLYLITCHISTRPVQFFHCAQVISYCYTVLCSEIRLL